jgi:predicted ATPase
VARHPASELSPQQRKEKTLAALLAQLDGLAREQPVLMLFEDLHWIDPTSLELLTAIVDRVQRLPVLLLATARPEFTPPWPSQAHVTALSLTRLSRRECVALVERVTEGKALPDEVLEQILARTDGVPLFIEELTRTVIESGMLIDMGDRYRMAGPLPSLAIPTTLHDSLTARLDRLAPVKEVAQIAACIGRDFDYDLLSRSPKRPAIARPRSTRCVEPEWRCCLWDAFLKRDICSSAVSPSSICATQPKAWRLGRPAGTPVWRAWHI